MILKQQLRLTDQTKFNVPSDEPTIAKYLIKKGANVTIKNNKITKDKICNGCSALHWAALKGNKKSNRRSSKLLNYTETCRSDPDYEIIASIWSQHQ